MIKIMIVIILHNDKTEFRVKSLNPVCKLSFSQRMIINELQTCIL